MADGTDGFKAVLYWFTGIMLASISLLLIGLYAVAKVFGIPPEVLAGLISVWLSCSLIIALMPMMLIAIGVADDQMIKCFSENGRRLTLRYNIVAWVVWACMLIWWLFHKMCPPDDEDRSEF
ncbi:MAG: hypothetical protein Q8L52_01630 [bacterium]|nr:hypothetical protein [bacterium]